MPTCVCEPVAVSDFLHMQLELAHAMTLAATTVIAVCATVMTVGVLFIPCLCVNSVSHVSWHSMTQCR